MARFHNTAKPGEKIISLDGEIETFPNATDHDADENLKIIGITEAQLDEAMAAAQAVLDKYGINAFVSEFSVLQNIDNEKCRCGSRCVSRTCEPYCVNYPNNTRACGHRLRCTGTACNPC